MQGRKPVKLKRDVNYSNDSKKIGRLNVDLEPQSIYTGIILSEILGKPKALKKKIR